MRDNITAVMIGRDEEQFLAQCLESLKGIMPVKFVDTGSTDRTMEIARDYGAVVLEHPWQDSFSEARNYALQDVPTPWAFQIDCDEQLVSATVGELDNLDLQYDAYMIQIHNVMSTGVIHLNQFERIHQPAKVHYADRVQNQLVYESADMCQLSILHYGYGLSPEEMQKKYDRTERLLMMDIDEHGYTPKNVRYLIQGYRAQKRYADILKALDAHLDKLSPSPGPYQESASAYIVAYNAMEDNTRAKSKGLYLLEKFPEALDALFYMGVLSMECEEWEFAIDHFLRYIKTRRLLQMEGSDPSVCYHTWGNLAEAFQHVAICEIVLGNKARAMMFFMRAEMLAKGRSDISTFAANLDNAMCTLRGKPVAKAAITPLGIERSDKAIDHADKVLEEADKFLRKPTLLIKG